MNLEDDLRFALRRVEAPVDFAATFRKPPSSGRSYYATAAAVALLALIPIGIQEYRERRQGETAKEELKLAMHVASGKLQHTRELMRKNQ